MHLCGVHRQSALDCAELQVVSARVQNCHERVTTARQSTKNSPFRVPILAMSATFTMADQIWFNELIHCQPTMVFWGEMDCAFKLCVLGQPMTSLIADWTKIARK